MSTLPDGGKAWFVRTKGRRGRCHMKPVSFEGRLLTGLFTAWAGVLAWWFANQGDALGFAGLSVGVSLVLASTLLYIVTALHMSAPAQGNRK